MPIGNPNVGRAQQLRWAMTVEAIDGTGSLRCAASIKMATAAPLQNIGGGDDYDGDDGHGATVSVTGSCVEDGLGMSAQTG